MFTDKDPYAKIRNPNLNGDPVLSNYAAQRLLAYTNNDVRQKFWRDYDKNNKRNDAWYLANTPAATRENLSAVLNSTNDPVGKEMRRKMKEGFDAWADNPEDYRSKKEERKLQKAQDKIAKRVYLLSKGSKGDIEKVLLAEHGKQRAQKARRNKRLRDFILGLDPKQQQRFIVSTKMTKRKLRSLDLDDLTSMVSTYGARLKEKYTKIPPYMNTWNMNGGTFGEGFDEGGNRLYYSSEDDAVSDRDPYAVI